MFIRRLMLVYDLKRWRLQLGFGYNIGGSDCIL